MTAALALKSTAPAEASRAIWGFLDDPESAEAVRTAAESRGGAPSIAAGGTEAALKRIAREAPPRVLIVGIQGAPDPVKDIRMISERVSGETYVVALGTINDVTFYRELLQAGASDYLVLPLDAGAIGSAFDRAFLAPAAVPNVQKGEVGIIAVTGTAGGAGASTLAVNAAWHLAAECGRRVALIDLDAHFGRAALSLDLDPSHGIREILLHPERIDSLFIAGALIPARTGLWVLSGEEPLDTRVDVTAAAVDSLLDEIVRTTESINTVVLDVPRALVANAPETLCRAGAIAVVTELSLAGIRDTNRLCERIGEVCNDDTLHLIAGKVTERGRGEIDSSEFERGTGRKIMHALPWDPKPLGHAGRDGKALAEVAATAPLARAIARAAEKLAGVDSTPKGTSRLIGVVKHALGKR